MNNNNPIIRLFSVIICILVVASLTSCIGNPANTDPNTPPPPPTGTNTPSAKTPAPTTPGNSTETPVETPTETANTPDPDPTPTDTATPEPDIELFPYNGVVEHLFFHEAIAYPKLAFDRDSRQAGYEENMVTVSEYIKMLDSIYYKGYILVNLNDIWSEDTNDKGELRMKKNTLMLPAGKKPLVLSFDDLSFYNYMKPDGFMEKYIIGDDGEIWASGFDPDGNPVVSQDLAVITILDKFVKQHPDFSLGGVKGCIALTGYEGILGYRSQFDKNNDTPEWKLNRMQEVARVRPVIQKLKDTGWYFATHSYGHINLNKASLEGVKTDAQRWLDEVGSLVGETKLFIYPFGSRLDGGDVYDTGPAFKYYQGLGFRVFASVGIEPYSRIKPDICAVICDRMHADGGTLARERDRYLKFYDANLVWDPLRPKKGQ